MGISLKIRRWLIVGYLLLLMAFTTSILLIPGEKYRVLTTSDSGWFFDIAVDIAETDGMVEVNRLSHPPYGKSVSITDQGQPLMAAMLYKAVHAIDPDVTPMDVVQYWSLLLFALTLIPIFLIGRELGGDFAGCLAAFFAAFMTSSIYWSKFGAFDREVSQLILGAWTVYLTIRLFKAPRKFIPTFAVLAGLVYGIFGLTWGTGALYLATVIIGGLIFVLLFEFIEKLARRTADLIHSAFLTIRENLHLMAGAVGMLAVMTFMVYLAGGRPTIWVGFAQTLLGYVGIGGGGVSLPRYASEAAAPSDWGGTFNSFYGGGILSAIVFVLIDFALIKICLSRKRWEIFVLPWILVLAAMVWPGRGQARFERLWWPLIPVLAGVGLVAMVSMLRRSSLKIPSVSEWLDRIQKPLVIVVFAAIIAIPYIENAYATAERTTPPTEWHGYVSDRELMSTFDWLRENTPENSVVAIEWSYGHVLTGASRRASVCDGTETKEEEGKWENAATIHPPDYIYYVRDSTGYIYGVNVPDRPWTINGRRIDIQNLPLMDEREFLWLVQTYRDNYGCQIDYVIFYRSWVTEESGFYYGIPYYGLWYPSWRRWELREWKARASESTKEDQDFVLRFENRENVVFNSEMQSAFLRTDGVWKTLAGYVGIFLDEAGAIRDVRFNFPSPTPDIPETLLLFFDEDDNIFVQPDGIWAYLLDLSIPMIARVFSPAFYNIDYLEGIDYYLQVVYESPEKRVTICRINYVPQPVSIAGNPTDNAKTNDNTPTFRWALAISAERYELWVDNSPDFTSPEIVADNIIEVIYTPPDNKALIDGNYSWKIRAFDANNNATDWSPVWTFTVDTVTPSAPSLISPEKDAVENSLTQTFTWTQPEPDFIYHLQIDSETSFSSPYIREDLSVLENSYTYNFPANGTYYWRVRARDAAYNWSPWSENYKLIILAPAGQPKPSSPTNGGVINDNTPTFKWAIGFNADNHRLLIDDDNYFSSPIENRILGATSNEYTPADENYLADGNYSWKVVAINEAGENESAVWTFIVDTIPPGEPTLLAPDNGGTVRDSTPTFDWSSVTDAGEYELWVDDSSDFSLPEILEIISTDAFTPAMDLPDGNYFWRVRAYDAANNAGDFSPVWSFVIDTLG